MIVMHVALLICLQSMQAMGNSKGRAVYEANIPDDFRRPQTDSAVESFIRQKYEKKKFIAAEWVATKPPDVPVGWEDAGGLDTKKVEFKKLQLPARGSGGTSPKTVSPRAEAKTVRSTAPAPLTVSLPPVTATTTTSASSTVTDLLGLSMSSAAPAQPQLPSSSSQDLLGLNSEFSAFVSASPAGPSKTNDPTPSSQAEAPTPSDGRLSKDSILALFGPKSSPAPAQAQPNMFGQFQSPGLPGMNQFQSPAPSQPIPGQFQSPNLGVGQFQSPNPGLGQFQSPLGQFGGQGSPNPTFTASVANGNPHSNLLGLYNQPQHNMGNGFQSQPVINPFLDSNQMAGQLSGLNLGTASPAAASPSLWQ